MEKIKYIIILVLILLIGFLYTQLRDYHKISNSLLQQNSSSIKNIDDLELQISTLKTDNQLLHNTIATLKQKIFVLEEDLVLTKYDKSDLNTTISDTNTTKSDINTTNDKNTTIENQNFQKEEKSIFKTIQ